MFCLFFPLLEKRFPYPIKASGIIILYTYLICDPVFGFWTMQYVAKFSKKFAVSLLMVDVSKQRKYLVHYGQAVLRTHEAVQYGLVMQDQYQHYQ
jgi:hypothetical protein